MGKKVLYVSNGPAPDWVRQYFKDSDIFLDQQYTKKDAITKMQRNREQYSFLLLWDLNMGIDILREARKIKLESMVLINGEDPREVEEARNLSKVYIERADKENLYCPSIKNAPGPEQIKKMLKGAEIFSNFDKMRII
ncbi:MAG: hypothetical protein ABIH59_02030 [archaeon]